MSEQNTTILNSKIKKDVPFFLISLIEHKTQVEYNVCMQIFRYMVYIWESYEKEAEKKQPGITRTKRFRYPPILPIVYYEGQDKWTVPLDFKSRILEGETFARYIPDFRYHLVPLCDYSNDDLLANKDEISLVMLINKIQDEESLNVFRQLRRRKWRPNRRRWLLNGKRWLLNGRNGRLRGKRCLLRLNSSRQK